jgi:hypothetical protein
MIPALKIRTIRSLAAAALAVCMLTLVPVASMSFTNSPSHGGSSVIHKNGATPVWMATALVRATGGIWI